MNLATARVLVTLAAVTAVAVLHAAVGAPSTGLLVGVITVGSAVGLAVVRAARQAAYVAFAGLALAVGASAPLDGGAGALRWWSLVTLPTVVPLAGLGFLADKPASILLATGGLLAGPIRGLVYDPLLDPECRGCGSLPTLVAAPPSVGAALALTGGSLAVLGLGLGVRRDPQVQLPAVALLPVAVWAAWGWSNVRGTVPEAAVAAALVASGGAGLLLWRTAVARSHLRRMTAAIRSGTAVQDLLRRALRDGSLTLDLAADPHEWLDAEGRLSPGPAPGQLTTPVVVGAERVARIHHAPDSGRIDRLADSLTPELLLAIEHARLTAQLEARVHALQESRARVVEAADERRRRIERDLHDGAQQELLALGFDLRRAQDGAPEDARLARCVTEVTGALADLRTLAGGVYPALLDIAGLRPAVEQLSASARQPVAVRSLPDHRFAPGIERTAYLLVVDMAEQGPIEVSATVVDDLLRLCVDGPPLPAGSVVPERVASLGGALTCTPTRTEMTLPCG